MIPFKAFLLLSACLEGSITTFDLKKVTDPPSFVQHHKHPNFHLLLYPHEMATLNSVHLICASASHVDGISLFTEAAVGDAVHYWKPCGGNV